MDGSVVRTVWMTGGSDVEGRNRLESFPHALGSISSVRRTSSRAIVRPLLIVDGYIYVWVSTWTTRACEVEWEKREFA